MILASPLLLSLRSLVMNNTVKPDPRQAVAVLRAAFKEGRLRTRIEKIVAAGGNEVLASWGSAMRR
jgi:hypothetical protein